MAKPNRDRGDLRNIKFAHRWALVVFCHDHGRGSAAGNDAACAKSNGSKLTTAEVLSIRELRARGHKQKDIASQFGISREHVRDIASRKKWAWLK